MALSTRSVFFIAALTPLLAFLTFVPEDSQVCHPYVDQVEVAAATPDEAPHRDSETAADASGTESP